MTVPVQNPASYKDPSGFVFVADGKNYRQVNQIYKEHYDHLISSGLYTQLINEEFLLPHEDVPIGFLDREKGYKILLPEQLSHISYPNEWCFEQLKDAALLTLSIVKSSIEKGMILKDATPYNIQFWKGKPILIDTLSFEKYDEKEPWIAYRQFCETFLFPLLAAHYNKTGIKSLMIGYPDGIPINIVSKLLPYRSRFNLSVWMHVFLQDSLSKPGLRNRTAIHFSKKRLLRLILNLESLVSKLGNDNITNWNDYYTESIISNDYLLEKEKIFLNLLADVTGPIVLDMGANEGHFSILAAALKFNVIAIDHDEFCVQRLYKKVKDQKITNILPLCISATHPTGAYGFAGNERPAFQERVKADTVLALALVHHLVLANNIPLSKLAAFLSTSSTQLMIEFVPKDDQKAVMLLKNKKDIYTDYTIDAFEKIFGEKFTIRRKEQVNGTNRFIYFMTKL